MASGSPPTPSAGGRCKPPKTSAGNPTFTAGALEEPPMLHATMHAVDIALCILPAVFALMIAYDFVLYVKAQRRAAKHPQWVPAKPQPAQQPIPIPEVIKPEPIAAPIRHLSSNRAKSAVKHKTFT